MLWENEFLLLKPSKLWYLLWWPSWLKYTVKVDWAFSPLSIKNDLFIYVCSIMKPFVLLKCVLPSLFKKQEGGIQRAAWETFFSSDKHLKSSTRAYFRVLKPLHKLDHHQIQSLVSSVKIMHLNMIQGLIKMTVLKKVVISKNKQNKTLP